MLRATAKQKFLDILDETYFTSANFEVTIGDGMPDLLTIAFRSNPAFRFVIRQAGKSLQTEESPGEHLLAAEQYHRDDLADCRFAVREWSSRILEEYKLSHPVVDEFERFREQLEQRLQDAGEAANVRFSTEEVNELRRKLDELGEKLDEVADKSNDIERRLAAAQQELDKLKDQAAVVPKGVWYRMANNKIVSVLKAIATSKEGREFALDAAKKILLEGPK